MKSFWVFGVIGLTSIAAPSAAQSVSSQDQPNYVEVKELVMLRRPSKSIPRYPEEAERLGQSGETLIDCAIAARKPITDCRVVTESPEGFGFGDAAIAIFESGKISVGPKLLSGDLLPSNPRAKFTMKFRPPTAQ